MIHLNNDQTSKDMTQDADNTLSAAQIFPQSESPQRAKEGPGDTS